MKQTITVRKWNNNSKKHSDILFRKDAYFNSAEVVNTKNDKQQFILSYYTEIDNIINFSHNAERCIINEIWLSEENCIVIYITTI